MKNSLLPLALLLATASFAAQAQTSDFVELIPSVYLQKDLTASVGLGVIDLPKYVDGSEQHIKPLPLVDLQWKSGVFFSTVSGFGYNFSDTVRMQYGVRLGLLAYQEQSKTNRDTGPGNTPTDVEPGAFFNFLITERFTFLSTLSTGAGNQHERNGTLANVGLRYIERLSDQDRYYLILGSTWANAQYMQSYYGVTPEQASAYHFPVYNASAGSQKVKLSFGWDHALNKDWSLIAGGTVWKPLGAAADSPLASNKALHQLYGAAYYRF